MFQVHGGMKEDTMMELMTGRASTSPSGTFRSGATTTPRWSRPPWTGTTGSGRRIRYSRASTDNTIKGCTNKSVPFSKFEIGLLTRTVCPIRLSFSQFGVLMSTLNCEKENLLEQTVLVKRPLSNFEKGTLFFVHPLCKL